MRAVIATALGVAALAVAGCGGGDDGDTGSAQRAADAATPGAGLPRECGLDEIETVLSGFIDAVGSGDEGAVAAYVARQPELDTLSLHTGPGPDGRTLEVRAPAETYGAMRKLTRGEDFALLGAGVGLAPREERRAGPRADDPAAGADFTYVSARRSISGKVGINCATGQIYVGAMAAEPGPPRSAVFCGRELPADARGPLICAYEY